MIEEFKKTKASKLWFPMVVVFVVLLNVSFVEAKSLKKGEEFKEKSGNGAIRVVSSDEVEIERGSTIFLGKYTIDGERVRIVVNAGATMVQYYKITPDGLVEEKDGTVYYSKAGSVALKDRMKRAEEEQRKAALAAEEKNRKAALARARRFKVNGNGTVTDNDTKLMWQQGESGEMKWEPAISYCKGLPLAGYNDWRLPNLEELKTIIDVGKTPAIDKAYFPNAAIPASIPVYWSSTPHAVSTSHAGVVHFYNGSVDFISKTDDYYVRCVSAYSGEKERAMDSVQQSELKKYIGTWTDENSYLLVEINYTGNSIRIREAYGPNAPAGTEFFGKYSGGGIIAVGDPKDFYKFELPEFKLLENGELHHRCGACSPEDKLKKTAIKMPKVTYSPPVNGD